MTESLNNQGSEESKKPNPNPTQEANAGTDNLVNEIMQRLSLGASTASVGGEAFLRGSTNANASVGFLTDASTNVGARGNASENTRSSSGTVQVNCRPCGGCCGRRFGVRVPAEVYAFIAEVAKEKGLRECDGVNRLCPLLECRRGRDGVGSLDSAKWVEKFVIVGRVFISLVI
ncbi:hypothetical protein [Vulcanisaeta sp. JCM 14467]